MGLISQTDNSIRTFRGDDHSVTITVRKKSTMAPFSLVVQNVAGATAVLTVKKRAADIVPLFFVVGSVVGDGSTGTLQFDLVPSHTSNISPAVYIYDIQMTLSGKVSTLVKDRFEVLEDVTR